MNKFTDFIRATMVCTINQNLHYFTNTNKLASTKLFAVLNYKMPISSNLFCPPTIPTK